MIPAPKDSTQDPDAGAAPTVTGQDRIGAAPDGTPQTGPVTDELPASSSPTVAPEPTVFAPPVIAVPVDRLPPAAPGAIVAPPPAPDVTIRALEPASHRPALSDAAPAVRPVTSGLERPAMPPPPGPRLEPRLESTRVEPSLGGPTVALTPPILMPVAPHHPPTAASPADEPTIFVPPPPRRQPPPPPPAGGLTPPPPPPGGGRKPLVGGAERPPQQPQYVPMPSTITPAEPQRKRSRFRSKAARSSVVVVFDGVMSLATIVALVLWVGAFAGLHEFDLPGPLQVAKVVLIPPKKTRDEIGDILEQNGVVSNGTVFVYGSMIAQVTELKAGEYEFHPGATMRDVAEEIQQNKVVQHKITFPEGWTSEQIVQRLIDDPVLAGKVVAIPEEGSLLPDTYTYPRGETRQQILDRMHKNLDRRLTDIWAHRNADALKQLKVPKDLAILASIIEKETSKPDERPRIAAVFVNRLNRNMRLETDPTILYGLYGGKAWTESRTITKADLAAPNPYNTYKINGLPPGPIGNPGRASLEAAANPSQTNELFFVADGTGGHAFAETLDEHNKNVARWREIERQRKLADPTSNAPSIPGSGTGLLAAPAVVPPAAVTPGVRQPATPRPTTTTTRPRPRVTAPADHLPADVN